MECEINEKKWKAGVTGCFPLTSSFWPRYGPGVVSGAH